MKQGYRIAAIVLLAASTVFAQKQTKEFKESFTVNKDVTVSVNTVNTDVVFETWNQNKVEVKATIEIEGLSKEEAQEYFDNWKFEALGNSAKVKVTANGGNSLFTVIGSEPFAYSFGEDFQFTFEEPMIVMLDSLVVPPMPPLVLNKLDNLTFDMEAYQKDGEAYMKKWQEQFQKTFDKDYQKEMTKWQQDYAKNQAEMAKRRAEMDKKRQETMKARQIILKEKADQLKSMHMSSMNGESEITIKKDGKTIKVKVKKKIEIKMPKDAVLDINVRHGEVKLAANTNNINATLSYARLLAPVISGNKTVIESSYAPVEVGQWNSGKLVLNFSDKVAIQSASNIQLVSNSSDVVIQKLTQKAQVDASFGNLKVQEVSPNFSGLIIKLENMDSTIKLPLTDYKVSLELENSQVNIPKKWKIIKNGKTYKEGYNVRSDSPKKIQLSGVFSNIVFL